MVFGYGKRLLVRCYVQLNRHCSSIGQYYRNSSKMVIFIKRNRRLGMLFPIALGTLNPTVFRQTPTTRSEIHYTKTSLSLPLLGVFPIRVL